MNCPKAKPYSFLNKNKFLSEVFSLLPEGHEWCYTEKDCGWMFRYLYCSNCGVNFNLYSVVTIDFDEAKNTFKAQIKNYLYAVDIASSCDEYILEKALI